MRWDGTRTDFLDKISSNYLPDEDVLVLASVSLEIFILFETLNIKSDKINITVCGIFILKQNTPFYTGTNGFTCWHIRVLKQRTSFELVQTLKSSFTPACFFESKLCCRDVFWLRDLMLNNALKQVSAVASCIPDISCIEQATLK